MSCNHKTFVNIVLDAVLVNFHMIGPMIYWIMGNVHGWPLITIQLHRDVNFYFRIINVFFI